MSCYLPALEQIQKETLSPENKAKGDKAWASGSQRPALTHKFNLYLRKYVIGTMKKNLD